MSLAVLQDEQIAHFASIFYVLNPSGIFMSSIYTEPLFALLTFLGMRHMHQKRRLAAALYWMLATTVRANGILHAGFFVWDLMHRSDSRKPISLKSLFTLLIRCIQNLTCAFIVVSPFLALQFYAWRTMCNNKNALSEPVRPWCLDSIPLVYPFVQKHYWNNGFLKYFTLQQLPNFILASPIILLSLFGIYKYSASNMHRFLSIGFDNRTSKASRFNSEYLSDDVLPFVYLWTVMLFLCVTTMHVQVILRFFTSVPPLFWFLGHLFGKHSSKNNPNYQGLLRKFIFYYFVAYPSIGAILFANFLPPA